MSGSKHTPETKTVLDDWPRSAPFSHHCLGFTDEGRCCPNMTVIGYPTYCTEHRKHYGLAVSQ